MTETRWIPFLQTCPSSPRQSPLMTTTESPSLNIFYRLALVSSTTTSFSSLLRHRILDIFLQASTTQPQHPRSSPNMTSTMSFRFTSKAILTFLDSFLIISALSRSLRLSMRTSMGEKEVRGSSTSWKGQQTSSSPSAVILMFLVWAYLVKGWKSAGWNFRLSGRLFPNPLLALVSSLKRLFCSFMISAGVKPSLLYSCSISSIRLLMSWKSMRGTTCTITPRFISLVTCAKSSRQIPVFIFTYCSTFMSVSARYRLCSKEEKSQSSIFFRVFCFIPFRPSSVFRSTWIFQPSRKMQPGNFRGTHIAETIWQKQSGTWEAYRALFSSPPTRSTSMPTEQLTWNKSTSSRPPLQNYSLFLDGLLSPIYSLFRSSQWALIQSYGIQLICSMNLLPSPLICRTCQSASARSRRCSERSSEAGSEERSPDDSEAQTSRQSQQSQILCLPFLLFLEPCRRSDFGGSSDLSSCIDCSEPELLLSRQDQVRQTTSENSDEPCSYLASSLG